MRALGCSLVGLGSLLMLGGCADRFISDPPPSAERWRGISTAGPVEIAGCGPLAFDLAIWQDPLYLPRLIHGRADVTQDPSGFGERARDLVTTWWAGGYVSPRNAVQFDIGRQRPIYFRAKPYAVWRGTLAGDRATLVEAGSPCDRELTLTRG